MGVQIPSGIAAALAALITIAAPSAGAQGSEQMRPPATDVPGTRDAAARPRYRGIAARRCSSPAAWSSTRWRSRVDRS